MLDLFHFLLGSILAPLLVNVVSYVLERLFDLNFGETKNRYSFVDLE